MLSRVEAGLSYRNSMAAARRRPLTGRSKTPNGDVRPSEPLIRRPVRRVLGKTRRGSPKNHGFQLPLHLFFDELQTIQTGSRHQRGRSSPITRPAKRLRGYQRTLFTGWHGCRQLIFHLKKAKAGRGVCIALAKVDRRFGAALKVYITPRQGFAGAFTCVRCFQVPAAGSAIQSRAGHRRGTCQKLSFFSRRGGPHGDIPAWNPDTGHLKFSG
jgi:hypothetical protein